jgi:hypothetical protein
MLKVLADKFFEEAKGLTAIRYTLADTRVPYVSLTDHLLLTSGLAVSMVKEVLSRGRKTEDICGEPLSNDDLIQITRIAALLHDVGKVEGYRGHVERGERVVRERLQGEPLPQSITEMILRAVERHQLDYSPESLLEKIVCLADSTASAGDRPQLQRETHSYDELERLAGRNLDLERDIFGDQPGLSLVLGDVDRIKNYVFDTSKLPSIRGASEILNALNLEEIPKLFADHLAPECLIYAGGGSFLAVVPQALADTLIEEVHKRHVEMTGIATITCVQSQPLRYLAFAKGHTPYVDEEIKRIWQNTTGFGKRLMASHPVVSRKKRGFGEIVAFLAADLKRAKESKPFAPVIETLPLMQRCTYCGLRPAESVLEDAYLCSICDTRIRQGAKSGRVKFANEFKGWVKDQKSEEITAASPESLDDLGGYTGFIYADGNDIGTLLEEKAITPAAFRHIAEVLQQETRHALFEALYRTFADRFAKLTTLPFEIVNIGGDDVSLFVKAPWAWEVTLRFLETFETRTVELARELEPGKEPEQQKLTASAGLCVAKSDYPVYYAECLADSLLKLAKRRAKQDPQKPVSAVCHLYLTASLAAERADDVLKAYYREAERGPDRRLTNRPYIVPEAYLVGEVASALQELFSRSQLHALVQALEQGLFASSNFFLYQLSRVMESDKRGAAARLKEALTRLGYDPQLLIWKWDEIEGLWSTCLYDALELVKMQEGKS